jgi:hypothetical protein
MHLQLQRNASALLQQLLRAPKSQPRKTIGVANVALRTAGVLKQRSPALPLHCDGGWHQLLTVAAACSVFTCSSACTRQQQSNYIIKSNHSSWLPSDHAQMPLLCLPGQALMP